jgi:hypothetical protein
VLTCSAPAPPSDPQPAAGTPSGLQVGIGLDRKLTALLDALDDPASELGDPADPLNQLGTGLLWHR